MKQNAYVVIAWAFLQQAGHPNSAIFFKSFFLLPLGLWVYDYVNIVCDAEQTLFYLGHRFVARFIDLLYHIDIVYK